VLGFAGNKLAAWELDDRLETLRRDTPTPAFFTQMNLLGSHDTARILTVLGSRERVMLAAALQLAYPGVPMVYYGDEVGIEGGYAEASRIAYPWGGGDKQLLDFYRQAINARRASKALSLGDVQTVWVDERGGYGFLRSYQNERVLALFNNSDAPLDAHIVLQDLTSGSTYPDLLGRITPAHVSDGTLNAEIPPYGAGWFNL
jgi:glycosidase